MPAATSPSGRGHAARVPPGIHAAQTCTREAADKFSASQRQASQTLHSEPGFSVITHCASGTGTGGRATPAEGYQMIHLAKPRAHPWAQLPVRRALTLARTSGRT